MTCIYFSKTGCVGLNILPAPFPYPIPTTKKSTIEQILESTAPTIPPCTKSTIPPQPNKIPFTSTVENVPKLELYLRSNFSATAFGKSSLFPGMSAQPAHIHLNQIQYHMPSIHQYWYHLHWKLISRLSPIQWSCKTGSQNFKENNLWQYQPGPFIKQWQYCQSDTV